MKNSQKLTLYFLFQFLGWGIYTSLVGFSIAGKIGVNLKLVIFLLAIFTYNILISHIFRILSIRFNWFTGNIIWLVVRTVISSLILGFMFSIAINCFNSLINGVNDQWLDINTMITGFFLYSLWNLIYLTYQYFDLFKTEELKNVKLAVLKNETELKNLRSQLNPHFMFNAMNSIRALVDENPEEAKLAITKLSNILRNALIHSRDNLISLKQEIDFVSDYLSLEKIRYEERLKIIIDLPQSCNSVKIPPLLIQTLVENAIKHGISKLIKGGEIIISCQLMESYAEISIINSGKIEKKNKTSSGIGIENTIKRLDIEYGDEATFLIHQPEENKVEVLLKIPIK